MDFYIMKTYAVIMAGGNRSDWMMWSAAPVGCYERC